MDRILLAAALVAGAAGCLDWDSLYEQRDAAATDDIDSAPDIDATPNPLGCSDRTAEALFEPGMAACAGAWLVPGVVNETEPTCGRAAGNNGTNASGEGCSVADLCAVGWHVCRDAADVGAHGGDSACDQLQPPDPENGDLFLYVTRQGGRSEDQICDPDGSAEGADDVWGCGTLGTEAPECKPLNRHIGIEVDGGVCPEPFECGDDSTSEGLHVVKTATHAGGALCCSDASP